MSKLAKFVHSPELYFLDSGNPAVKSLGQRISKFISTEQGTVKLVYSPTEVLAESSLPILSQVARYSLRHASKRRQHSIEIHGTPLVSVIMPAHNAASTIAKSLESLVRQSYSNLEILVVNDGSSDETGAIVEKFAEGDARLRLLDNTLGRGAALARNCGMQMATGNYLCFQDSDDRSTPERIEQQLAILLSNDDAIVSCCDYYRESSGGLALKINGRVLSRSILSMMFERERILERIGYMRNTKVGEDSEYYQRIKLVFGKECGRHIWKPLYVAGFDEYSLLFSDGNTSVEEDGSIYHYRSEASQRSMESISRWHLEIQMGAALPYVGPEGDVDQR